MGRPVASLLAIGRTVLGDGTPPLAVAVPAL